MACEAMPLLLVTFQQRLAKERIPTQVAKKQSPVGLESFSGADIRNRVVVIVRMVGVFIAAKLRIMNLIGTANTAGGFGDSFPQPLVRFAANRVTALGKEFHILSLHSLNCNRNWDKPEFTNEFRFLIRQVGYEIMKD
jgi:hypothetical protein